MIEDIDFKFIYGMPEWLYDLGVNDLTGWFKESAD